MNRRQFLNNSAAATVGVLALGAATRSADAAQATRSPLDATLSVGVHVLVIAFAVHASGWSTPAPARR